MERCDFLIVGGGIAGISAGAWLAERGRAIVLEREDAPGYHTTGRSAALYTEKYGNAAIRALTRGSGAFLRNPPDGFSDHSLLTPRGMMFIARADQRTALDEMAAELSREGNRLEVFDSAEAVRRLPILDPNYVAAALLEPAAMDIDVHALLQGYLKLLKSKGGRLVAGAEVSRLERAQGEWRIVTRAGEFRSTVLINASGAWADEIARLAGLEPLGLEPLRRTAVTVDLPPNGEPAHWPMAHDIEDQFYFKPEAGRLLASPADETPSPPCDAQADELDVALAIERLERATTIRVRRITHRWAGLRTFAPDRTTVLGYDPAGEGFFWVAGQGGYGIQTSPAMGRAAAALVGGEDLPSDLRALGLTQAILSPARFRG